MGVRKGTPERGPPEEAQGWGCFPKIISKLRRTLKTQVDEDLGLEDVFGVGMEGVV